MPATNHGDNTAATKGTEITYSKEILYRQKKLMTTAAVTGQHEEYMNYNLRNTHYICIWFLLLYMRISDHMRINDKHDEAI